MGALGGYIMARDVGHTPVSMWKSSTKITWVPIILKLPDSYVGE